MKKKVAIAAMAIVLTGSGAAFAGGHWGYGYHHNGAPSYGRYGQEFYGCGAYGRAIDGRGPAYGGPSGSWFYNAPQAVRDAARELEVKRGEIHLEIAKGNADAAKLRTLHDGMLKARRTIADYHLEQALKSPSGAREFLGGRAFGMRGGEMCGGVSFGLLDELQKDKPDTARVRKIYSDLMNLREKHAKENFELCLKYPDSFNGWRGGY